MTKKVSRTARVSVATLAAVGTPFVLVGMGARGVHHTYAGLKGEIHEDRAQRAKEKAEAKLKKQLEEAAAHQTMTKAARKVAEAALDLVESSPEVTPELIEFYKSSIDCKDCLSEENNYSLCPVHLAEYAALMTWTPMVEDLTAEQFEPFSV